MNAHKDELGCPNCDGAPRGGPCLCGWRHGDAEHRYDADCPRCQEDGPPDDGESFRGGEAAAFERESMTAAQRLK